MLRIAYSTKCAHFRTMRFPAWMCAGEGPKAPISGMAVIHAAVFASENWSVDSKKMTAIHSPTGPQAASTPLSGMRSATAPAGADAPSFPTALTLPAPR